MIGKRSRNCNAFEGVLCRNIEVLGMKDEDWKIIRIW